MLAIIDYKAGNQTSVRRALEHLGIPCEITADSAKIENADGVIFPGVGAAGQAMQVLYNSGLDAVLHKIVNAGHPLLGICLGCQILLDESEENATKTLGIVSGRCRRFPDNLQENSLPPQDQSLKSNKLSQDSQDQIKNDTEILRIPHMGWNTLDQHKKSPLLAGIDPNAAFYFVHSYYVETSPENVIATTHYGFDFCSVYGHNGLWAVQFHPEKSGEPGLRLLTNFHDWCKDRQ